MTTTTTTTTKATVTLKTLVKELNAKPEASREEYLYYYLRQIFPNSSEAAIEMWAGKVRTAI